MNIAVCEDNADDTLVVCGYLRRYMENNRFIGNIHTFTSGEELLNAFSLGTYDAVFMDVYMNGMTGIETARKLRLIDSNFALILITISEDHARDAFSVRACAYVSKSIDEAEINIAFSQCGRIFLKNARFIEISSDHQIIKIPIAKILYVEVFDKKLLIHTTTYMFKTYMSLDEAEIKLGKPFLRCHRAYLINMNYVDEICEHDILMKNGDLVPMRQRKRSEIRDAYSSFLTDRLFEVI